MSAFQGSYNKSVIRKSWDLPIISEWSRRIGRPLAYLGLPGPSISDLLDWGHYFGKSTGVERLRQSGRSRDEDLEVHRQILKNVMINDIVGFELLRGLLEDIILYGVDQDGKKPSLSTTEHPSVASFHYDIINLDFLGGIGYINEQGESKRVRALRRLFERQRRTSFLLLLTLNVRDGIGEEITRYLVGAGREAANHRLIEDEDTLRWYAECGRGMKQYKLKAVVPLFIRREAEKWGFDCFCYPVITYIGSGSARMVHFVFELTHITPVLHAFSQQSESDLLNLLFFEVDEGVIKVMDKQHPHYNYDNREAQVSFLSDETGAPLVQAIQAKQKVGSS